ncbi:MAG: hypothetical protein V4793_31185, partial [Paraburkholderia tropica]
VMPGEKTLIVLPEKPSQWRVAVFTGNIVIQVFANKRACDASLYRPERSTGAPGHGRSAHNPPPGCRGEKFAS